MHSGEWLISSPPAETPLEAVRLGARRAAAEVWRFLPAWMFFIYGCLLLNTELTNLEPARRDLAWTAVFPLGVFVAFYAARALRAPDVRNRAALLGTTFVLALGLPALNLAWHRPSPLSHEQLLFFFELSNLLWAALFLAHALHRRPSHAVLFFGVGLSYGLLLENGGIVLGFFHETLLTATMVPPLVAPLATVVGWSLVLYMSTFVTWHLREWVPGLRRSAALSALVLATVATLLDLQIDPLATAAGCWIWDASLPPAFHGVPLVNFVAWMCAVWSFGYVMFRVQALRGIADGARWTRPQLGYLLAWVPGALVLAAAAFMVSTALLEGVNGPSWTLLNRFFDGALRSSVALAGWVE